MSERITNVVGDVIEEILDGEMTAGEQVRFQGIMERMLASDRPADQYLHASIMVQLADEAQAQYEREEEGRIYSVYTLGRVGKTDAFYIGASKDVQARYASHLQAARSASSRDGQLPVAVRIRAEMPPNGPGVWVETLLPNLTLETAKSLEGSLVSELVRNGADLENRELLGKHGPANRQPKGSLAYNEANREANRECHRRRLANDPEFRSHCLAKNALWDLKQGRRFTPRKVEVITLAGRVEDALAILRSQGRESDWPRDGPME